MCSVKRGHHTTNRKKEEREQSISKKDLCYMLRGLVREREREDGESSKSCYCRDCESRFLKPWERGKREGEKS